MTTPNLPLQPLEIASGLVSGPEPGWTPLTVDTTLTPRQALEQAIVPALQRAPCVVSFSGGRDSSAVLAVATHVARKHGLPEPVPVSLRFPGVETADEAQWQELVVRHLQLQDWERCYFTDEMDTVGPVAQGVLRRHGVLWPFNAHFHQPVIERARGGSVLTGVGGDEVLLSSAWVRVNRLRAGSASPRPLDLVRFLVASGPLPLRSLWFRRYGRINLRMPWLRPEAQRELVSTSARRLAAEPVPWDEWLRRAWWPHRSRVVAQASLTALAEAEDTRLLQPLQDAAFLAALARDPGAEGFRGRTHAMRQLFGDLLPPSLISRQTKSSFDGAFVTPIARAFVQEWEGCGVDLDVVDPEALAATWRSEGVDPRSLLLLQHVWCQRAAPA